MTEPTKVIAICRAVYDPAKVRGGVRDRLLNDLFKLHLQAEAIHNDLIRGQRVNAYLIVLSDDICEMVNRWICQYQLQDFVQVLAVAPPKVRDLRSQRSRNLGFLLEAEKEAQAVANQVDEADLHKMAVTTISKAVAKQKAKQAIHSHLRNWQFMADAEPDKRLFIPVTLSGQRTTRPGAKPPRRAKKASRQQKKIGRTDRASKHARSAT